MFRNINDGSVWTLDDLKQLRKDYRKDGMYVYDSFEEWLENQLECDFERI